MLTGIRWPFGRKSADAPPERKAGGVAAAFSL